MKKCIKVFTTIISFVLLITMLVGCAKYPSKEKSAVKKLEKAGYEVTEQDKDFISTAEKSLNFTGIVSCIKATKKDSDTGKVTLYFFDDEKKAEEFFTTFEKTPRAISDDGSKTKLARRGKVVSFADQDGMTVLES